MEASRRANKHGSGKWWVRDGHTTVASKEAKVEMGARIRAVRLAQGLRAREVADAVGRHPSSVSDLERGAGSFSMGFLFQVAEALDVDPSALLPKSAESEEYQRGYRHGYLEAISRLQEDIPQG